mmetsp:Transcript_6767/g.19786  ORF Transcript_6767/g.19786 Transcript_6767/m.19786 type:complete len:269 (-) Transcript_6767:4030-4836(-)
MMRCLPSWRHPHTQAILLSREKRLHCFLQHRLIQEHPKGTCSHGCKLAEHDVLAHTFQAIPFTECSSIQQNIHSLLETATHEGSRVLPVDSMPRDSHEVTPVGHHIAKNGQVAVVHIRPVKLDHAPQLVLQRVPACLDTKDLHDFWDVVTCRSRVVHTWVVHYLKKVDSLGVQHPLLFGIIAILAWESSLGVTKGHLLDIRNPLQNELVQQVDLNLSQELVVIRGIIFTACHLLVQDSNSQNQLVGVVVAEYAGEVIGELGRDTLGNL